MGYLFCSFVEWSERFDVKFSAGIYGATVFDLSLSYRERLDRSFGAVCTAE